MSHICACRDRFLNLDCLHLLFYDGYGVVVVLCLMCMCLHCISAFGRVHRIAGLMVLPAVPSATRQLWTGPRFAYLGEMWVILSLSLVDISPPVSRAINSLCLFFCSMIAVVPQAKQKKVAAGRSITNMNLPLTEIWQGKPFWQK